MAQPPSFPHRQITASGPVTSEPAGPAALRVSQSSRRRTRKAALTGRRSSREPVLPTILDYGSPSPVTSPHRRGLLYPT